MKHPFSVDAQLLRELGERLVGRPHIALAELIKNAYDADATVVKIEFSGDEIRITDNGHGMSENDFATKWLRIGTVHKVNERLSPRLERRMTGSKGVGRLAAQLLARGIEITSVALKNPADARSNVHEQISASIDWDEAVREDDLTSIEVDVRSTAAIQRFPGGSRSGTSIRLKGLVEEWDKKSFAKLGEEIWALQPPFEDLSGADFSIELLAEQQAVVDAFAAKMNAIFGIWNARITGRLLPLGTNPPEGPIHVLPMSLPDADDDDDTSAASAPRVVARPGPGKRVATLPLPTRYLEATVELRGISNTTAVWKIENSEVDKLDFEILVFDLVNRQPENLKVTDARNYLRRFGGIGIYDNGFRLPYYGAEQDWLDIERDHSARLNASKLVPSALRVDRGLSDLPTNRRLYGTVDVSTSHEADVRIETGHADNSGLAIQVTRDRLIDNRAYQVLRVLLRAPIDLYAMERARARQVEIPRTVELLPASSAFEDLRQTLRASRPDIPPTVFAHLERSITAAANEVSLSEKSRRGYSALLGALATAGMTSLAVEHEMSKQVSTIRDLADRLDGILPDVANRSKAIVEESAAEIRAWATRSREIRKVFEPLMSSEDRDTVDAFEARNVIRDVKNQVRSLSHEIDIDFTGVPIGLSLPSASYPAWTSLFQNLLVNAFNALRHMPGPLVTIDGRETQRGGQIRVMDNGVGVDLATATDLWKPFERRLNLSANEIEEGMGGTGLGLTIVRMIADEMRVRVYFSEPPPGQSTAVNIEWNRKA